MNYLSFEPPAHCDLSLDFVSVDAMKIVGVNRCSVVLQINCAEYMLRLSKSGDLSVSL